MKWLRDRFKYAFEGLAFVLKDRSIRFQMFLGCIALIASAILQCNWQEWLWILLSITLVITAEIFNSCIERTVDYISLERNIQAKRIKDMAATAVFFASLFALIVALVILLPKAWRLLLWIIDQVLSQ